MISTYQLKSRFQALLHPLAALLHRCGVTANQVTVTTCVISLALGLIVIWQIVIVHPAPAGSNEGIVPLPM